MANINIPNPESFCEKTNPTPALALINNDISSHAAMSLHGRDGIYNKSSVWGERVHRDGQERGGARGEGEGAVVR